MYEQRPPTAKLSEHARQRAAEMGICTKRIKHLLRNPEITRPSALGRWIATSNGDPDLKVIFAKELDGTVTVVTVLYRQYDWYDRETGESWDKDCVA